MNKKLIYSLYTLIVVCIGIATVIEKYRGTQFVGEHIYGAWWFSALWAVLTVAACAYMMKQRLYKRVAVMLLHASFVVILAGALTTHLFARRGTISLRTDIPSIAYIDKAQMVHHLPFSLTLKEFRVINYPGTDAPLDYQSVIQWTSQTLKNKRTASGIPDTLRNEVTVSMNHIGDIDGYRLYQMNYDSDGCGVTLGVSHDPYGITITYIGYLLLLLGIIATLLSRQTQMRALYRKAMTAVFLFVSLSANAQFSTNRPAPRDASHWENTQFVVDKDIAHKIGTIQVLYNNRICPLNTVATDFVTKLTGKASWGGYSADEIFTSWMIYYSPWEQQKLIRVKSRQIQKLLGISGQWASYNDFLNDYHEYKLEKAIETLRTGLGDSENQATPAIDRKGLLDADEKFHLIEMFYQGQFIKMFPFPLSSTVNWYSPGAQSLPREIPVKEQFFIKQSIDFLTESIVTGQRDRAFEIIAKVKLFQRDMIGEVLPSETSVKVEVFYNSLRSQKWMVFLALTLSLLLCIAMLSWSKPPLLLSTLLAVLLYSLFLYVTLMLGLRWWLSGHLPVSNGHETMLFMAWVALLLTILLRRTLPILTGFGPLIASFCLLVSVLAGTGSQITPLMPVLQSPLLSVHVMTVMCAYALFALQVLLGVQALLLTRRLLSSPTGEGSGVRLSKSNSEASMLHGQLERTTALSQLLLYPAVFLLAIGIFLGAVWANVSWGNYWSWDPKESWALITLMVYAVPLHKASIGAFRKPRFYHLYMITAFLTVVITYFGVNYLLGGMHSYA